VSGLSGGDYENLIAQAINSTLEDVTMPDPKKVTETTEAQVIELELFKEHGKVNQFRASDQSKAILTGGVYVSKSYLGQATKRIRITVEEL